MIKVGDYVKMTKKFKRLMTNPCLDRGHHFEFSSEEDCISCSIGHVEEFGNSIGKVLSIDEYNDAKVVWLPTNLKYHYSLDHLEICELSAFV